MGAGFYLSITVCVLALALSVVLLALWLRDRRRLRRLTEQTQLFLQEGAHIPRPLRGIAGEPFAAQRWDPSRQKGEHPFADIGTSIL